MVFIGRCKENAAKAGSNWAQTTDSIAQRKERMIIIGRLTVIYSQANQKPQVMPYLSVAKRKKY
jgi:hypothetical protein